MTVTIRATPEQCFDYIGDYRNMTATMDWVKTYEPVGAKASGKGARFSSTVEVAGKRFDTELVVVKWDRPYAMVAESKSPRTRGTWAIEEFDDGTTDCTLEYEYEMPGIFRLVPGSVVGRAIETGLDRALKRIKRNVEAGARKPAPRRKAAATGRARR
ncbi:MAG: hypothetical protein QOE92_2180 [Chloroflexota bacterium]|jgi:uncharacterized membrane protein|nr:hypothetical protein [Chloroflexota bacterium]